MSNFDCKVQINIKNGRISKLMEKHGIINQRQLAQLIKVHATEVGLILNFKKSPVRARDGGFIPVVRKMAAFFCVSPAELFSDEQLDLVLASNRCEVYMSHDDATALADATPEYACVSLENNQNKVMTSAVVEAGLQYLTVRQREVISLRFGLGAFMMDGARTLDEVGERMGVSRERVRQVEAAAIRRLRLPTYGLHTLLEAA